MAVTADIRASYRRPGQVVSRLLAQGRREGFAFYILLTACVVIFVAQAPYQSRMAHLDDSAPLIARLYWSAFLWVFVMPLLLYVFAALIYGLAKLARREITGYGVRLSLFWAVLATSPLVLLIGLTAAFVGEGSALNVLGILWVVNFFWVWIAGMRVADRGFA